MKKVISLLLCFLLGFVSLIPVAAADTPNEDTVVYEDGSYIKVSDEFIVIMPDEYYDCEEESSTINILVRIFNLIRDFFSKILSFEKVYKTKYLYYYSADNELLWRATLKGEFRYNGKISLCTDSETGFISRNNDWKCVKIKETKNGNSVTAVFSVTRYLMGTAVKTFENHLTLTCDKNGNIT